MGCSRLISYKSAHFRIQLLPEKRNVSPNLQTINKRLGPILTIDGKGWVYEGTPVFGTPILKISGDCIYKGSPSWGAPIATVKGNYVYEGTGFLSAPIAVIDGKYVYKGSTKLGGPMANVSSGDRLSAAAAAVYLLLM